MYTITKVNSNVKKEMAVSVNDKPVLAVSEYTSYKQAGNYYLYGRIEEETIKPVIEWIFDENYRNKHTHLNLIITSQGGAVIDCFALLDAMEGSYIPVNTLGMGQIASCGLIIFLAGQNRVLTQNTQVLSHQWSGGNYGKGHELLAGRKIEDWLTDKLNNYYAEKTGLSLNFIKKNLLPESDVYLTPEEALKYNICTEIRGRKWQPKEQKKSKSK